MQQVRWGSLSSELLMCGGGVHSILLLPLVAKFLETIDVCMWHIFVFMSVVVSVGIINKFDSFCFRTLPPLTYANKKYLN